MITKLTSIVPPSVKDMKAAEYMLRAFPMLGKARLNALIRQKQLKIGEGRADVESLVAPGAVLTLYLDGIYDRSLRVLGVENGLMAFVKPRGLPVDRDEYGIGEDTVLSRLRLIEPDARLAHRLDAGTYGVMLAAIGSEAEIELAKLFKSHLLTKKYSATVLGRMPKMHDTLRAYLIKDGKRSIIKVVDRALPGAVDIETVYSVLSEFSKEGVSLSRLSILIPTGRTHQIRAHLAHIGHPLLGDDKYGDRSVNRQLGQRETDLSSVEIAVKNVTEAGKYAGMRFALPPE